MRFNNPDYWLDRADEARAMADRMKNPVTKQMMITIARDYERLARAAEAMRRETTTWQQPATS